KARVWLGDLTNAPYRTYCDGVRAIIEYLPDHPDVLVDAVACFDLKQRRYPEQAASLLARALEVDPGHRGALEMLARKVWIKGDDLGVDAATLDRHRRTLYEIAEDDNGKIAAAGYIHAAAVGRSDPNAAAAIREKVRRDLAFDTLDYDTEHRADSLQRTCGDDRLYDLDLEALCLDALVSLARSAADAGDAIPDNVLDRIGDVLDRLRVPHAVGGFRYRSWRTGPKTGAVARLKAVLDAHPEPLRSSEHYRAHARTAADWAARIGALRRAVDLDSGNFAAQCDLADALAWTGERDEARSFYKNVDEATVPPCDFESALVTLDELDRQDEMLLRVTPPR
ncbi:MAG: hypothetical protein OXH09_23000, partial [Gammaproteobacteria bacterium]|nr:hypothetical protein [Gammaproteobacteria bacterium]